MEGQVKNGTILTSESGNKYEVVNLLGAGGQGEVYNVKCNGSHYALKWYFKGSATERQKKILETIIAKGSPDESFLWPMELIVPAKSPHSIPNGRAKFIPVPAMIPGTIASPKTILIPTRTIH